MELPSFIKDGVCKNDGSIPCHLGFACDGCPYNPEVVSVKRLNEACPFPDKACFDKDSNWKCPFLQLRYAFDDDGKRALNSDGALYYECVWKAEIKPALEKERMAHELLKLAWSELDTLTKLTDIEDEKDDTKS